MIIDAEGATTRRPPLPTPRRLHSIWIGPAPIPQRHQDTWREWQRLHPGWEFFLWTDEQVATFRMQNFREYRQASTWAAKADILRYEILLKYGGVYVDRDQAPRRNIEPLLLVAPCIGMTHWIQCNNAFIAGPAGHSFFRQLVDGITGKPTREDWQRRSFMELTGPPYITRVAQKNGEVTFLARHLIYPEAPNGGFTEHHWDASWVPAMKG